MKISNVQLMRSVCRESFVDFCKNFWHTVVPEKLIWNWHMELICNELQIAAERVFAGMAKEYDLVVNVAPGSSKSTIASILFPAWCWTRMPSFRFIGASYAHNLAMDLSRKNRDVILSEEYQKCFPDIQLREDQSAKSYFVNTKGGARYTTGSLGMITGMHSHWIGIDDPINPKEALSEQVMYQINNWIKETLSSRKVDRRITVTSLIMQRLHQEDPTAQALKKKRIRHICIPAELTDDVNPPQLKKFYKNGLMDPTRLPKEVLEEAMEEMGPYGYCTPGFSPILMSNFREKKIEDVEVGDEVVGFATGGISGDNFCSRERSHLVKSRVVAKSSRIAEVVRIVMESGREVYCTADHKWWTGRTPSEKEPHRKKYAKARVGSRLMSIYEPFNSPTVSEQRKLDWLGGMIDGEGSCRHGAIQITQSVKRNRLICDKIDSALTSLDFAYTRYTQNYDYPDYRNPERKSKRGTRYCWNLLGGRSTKIRLINNCMMTKKKQIVKGMWKRTGRVIENEDRIISIESVGKMRVYGLTTTTGNYVAWGYGSKNCGQYKQNPVPSSGGMFDTTRLNYGMPSKLVTVWRSWDKAGTANRSKKGRGAFTVGAKIGMDDGNRIWILDIIRVRLGSYDREKLICDTAEEDGKNVKICVEQEGGSGGKESAEGTVSRLIGYHIVVDRPVGDKETRADPFSVQVNAGNVWLVPGEWNDDFVNEMKFFPFSTTKDQIDACSAGFSKLGNKKIRVGRMRSRYEPDIRLDQHQIEKTRENRKKRIKSMRR